MMSAISAHNSLLRQDSRNNSGSGTDFTQRHSRWRKGSLLLGAVLGVTGLLAIWLSRTAAGHFARTLQQQSTLCQPCLNNLQCNMGGTLLLRALGDSRLQTYTCSANLCGPASIQNVTAYCSAIGSSQLPAMPVLDEGSIHVTSIDAAEAYGLIRELQKNVDLQLITKEQPQTGKFMRHHMMSSMGGRRMLFEQHSSDRDHAHEGGGSGSRSTLH